MIVTTTEDRITATPNATMYGLAAPSVGSAELSTWRVRMPAGNAGPAHVVDREQVFMPVSGSVEITVDGVAEVCGPGQAAVLPAGSTRRIAALEDVEALVAMPAGATVTADGREPGPLPWAV
ncbi:cupin domain-containing protein [Actinokineospora sp. UTMC 2448]|uniref:cupin domain-containing protein n=1 Tax=Actinokineospora sp. UTMC 2448 TaxID=2268449 RepID=UPI00216479E9|nr:cupin domain-containing protein [Actinokineospora sp. UTMC 2448]UVS81954.1 Cupin domain protein [Actinokineospora sp. UTMC 2448]